jgi:predicted ferric reductase
MLSVWHVTRSAGLTAYFLLFLATASGLLLALRIAPQRMRPALYGIHKSTGWGVVIFAMVHSLVLLLDTHVGFTLSDILVPFATANHSSEIGTGILGMYAFLIATVTAVYRSRKVFQNIWGTIHRLAMPGYILTLYHSVTLGTDAKEPEIMTVYIVTTAIIIGLLAAKGIVGYRRGGTLDARSTR